MKKRAGNLGFLSVVLIIVSLVSSTNTTFKAIPYAYAQTNAAVLATFEANDNIVNNTVTNKTTVDTNEGLEIKNKLNTLMALRDIWYILPQLLLLQTRKFQ